MVYNLGSNPTNGPFPRDLEVDPGAEMITVNYGDEFFAYDNTEISGFSVCCVEYEKCDNVNTTAWITLDRTRAEKAPDAPSRITVDIRGICGPDNATALAYLWKDIPTERMLGLPIYSNDSFQLPGPPWKLELAK